MHPYERIIKAAKGDPIDHIPSVLWAIGQTYAPFYRIPDDEYYSNPARMFEAQIAFHKRFPDTFTIPGIWPDQGSIPIASAFGCEVDFPKNSPPRILKKAIESLNRVKYIKVPDPKKTKYTQRILKYLNIFKKNLPSEIGSRFGFLDGHVHLGGPVDRACLIAGHENIFIGMLTEPETVHCLIDKIVDFSFKYIEAQSEIVGKIKRITMCDHTPGLIGKDQFLEFVLPSYNRIFDFSNADLRIYHNENNWNYLIPHMKEIHCDVIHAGPALKWKEANKHIPQCIMGNLDPISVLAGSNCAEIRDEVRRILNQAQRHTNLWFSTGGGMHPRTSIENMQCMVDSVIEFSRSERRINTNSGIDR